MDFVCSTMVLLYVLFLYLMTNSRVHEMMAHTS